MLRKWMGALGVMCLASAAVAQDSVVDAVLQSSEFNETYDESSPVSGSPLVGLRLGEAGPSQNATFVAGFEGMDATLCVRVTTKDGRFYAANSYGLDGAATADLVRVSPLARKYLSQFGNYSAGQVAIRAYAGSGTCIPADAINLPVQHGPRTSGSNLVVFANGKSQPAELALLLGDATEVVAEIDCAPAQDGANIAYDLVCSLPLPDTAMGRAKLRLRFSDGFGMTDDYLYPVQLPVLAP